MAYESPIHLFQAKWSETREDAVDKAVLDEILKLGILVDRGELVKALEYDREQYQKGYADGRADAAKWISVKERPPKESGSYLTRVSCEYGVWFEENRYDFDDNDWLHELWKEGYAECATPWVTHWMPLPEPPEEEEHASD